MDSKAVEHVRISFLVPTLDRVDYVNRSVRSCLEQEHDGCDVEVIVLDSQSQDGSWPSLVQEFGDDKRVVLLQNARSSGPMRSWLDAANHATGDYITFVWSDDYLYPNFVQSLLPALREGASISFGEGRERPISEGAPDVVSQRLASRIPREQAVLAFAGFPGHLRAHAPVSPACALFRRGVLERWVTQIEHDAQRTELRAAIMWRRAMGPDLRLFLDALADPSPTVGYLPAPVAHFSTHPDSITVSSPPWPLRTGYWLARADLAGKRGYMNGLPLITRRRVYARVSLGGLVRIPVTRSQSRAAASVARRVRTQVSKEVAAVMSAGVSDVGIWQMLLGLLECMTAGISRPAQESEFSWGAQEYEGR